MNILFGIHSVSWICKFMPFIKIWKFSSIISSYTLSPSLSFLSMTQMIQMLYLFFSPTSFVVLLIVFNLFCYFHWVTDLLLVTWIVTILLNWWSVKVEFYFMQTGKINIHKYLWRIVGAFSSISILYGSIFPSTTRDEYFHGN